MDIMVIVVIGCENKVLFKVAVFFSERAVLRQIAKGLGLGEDVKISLNRYCYTCLYFNPFPMEDCLAR
jgi:hypothetical protein